MKTTRCLWVLALALSFASLWADERSTAERFEKAKRSEPELIAFLKQMPKGADLHNHVTGAIYSDFMLDHAVATGLHFNLKTTLFQREAGETTVPARQLQENWLYYRQFMYAVSMAGSFPAVKSGHDHFFDTFQYIGPANAGRSSGDILFEVIDRARAQNIQYLELMTSVSPGPAYSAFMANLPSTKDLDEAHAALAPRLPALVEASVKFVEERDAEISKRLGFDVFDPASPTTVRYVFSANRLAENDAFFAQIMAGMAIAQASPRVVSLNIVAPEDFVTGRLNFERQMEMIDYLWRRYGQPPLTLHAGELTLEISPFETMRNRIRQTIVKGHAQRIGHGISIAWEDDLPGLLAMMRERRVAVEVCLTSNASILKVEGDRHPIHLYLENGIPVTLNTDDEGVSRSNLTHEYVRAVRSYGFDYRQLKTFARNALEYSFLPGEGLYRGSYDALRPGFERVRDEDWTPDPDAREAMAGSQKLAAQVRLERAFVAFEK